MQYLVWSLPIAVVLASVVVGFLGPVGAGLLGTISTAAVAFSVAPKPLDLPAAALVMGEAAWLATLVGLVILAGLFFHEAVAARERDLVEAAEPRASRRARCFDACFLIGPFMEAVTGYGVGQVAAISALQRAGLRGRHLAIMALLSQTMVPWGAMANGTMVGATLSGLTPTLLGTYSAVLTLPLLAGWLAMFWRVARAAGVEANAVRHIEELCWIATIAILLVICNLAIGPESAGVTTLGALIALRFWLYERPSAARLRRAAKACVPYAALILGLLASRVLSGIAPALESVAVLKPLGNGPSLHPSTHPATWLVLIGCVTILSVKPSAMVKVAWSACQRGCRSVLAILLFLTMAKLMATSGMAEALGQGVRQLFGAGAPLTVPLLAGLFGFITGSGSASNGLLMPAQISLAREAYLDPGWIAAIQNVGAAALTMLSPARVATCCVLAGVPHLERRVYAGAWPFGGIVVAILVGVCAIMLVAKGAVPAMRWE